jgi:hypothetical protein
MKTAKIFTPSGGGERDNHPQMEIHLHKISDSAEIIGGESASEDSTVTLVVLYSHALVDRGMNKILYHILNTLTPIPPSFKWTTEGNCSEEISREKHIEITEDSEQLLYDTIASFSFSMKLRLLKVGFKDWYPDSYKELNTVNDIRNKIAHVNDMTKVKFHSNPINSDKGLNDYFLSCQSLRMELDEYFEKFIEHQIYTLHESTSYFDKIHGVYWGAIPAFISKTYSDRGIEPPKISLSKTEMMKAWPNKSTKKPDKS